MRLLLESVQLLSGRKYVELSDVTDSCERLTVSICLAGSKIFLDLLFEGVS